VAPRVGLNDLEERKFFNLLGLEVRLLSRPAHSQSLYRLSYRGSPIADIASLNKLKYH
jgi:hypothetical protein